MKSNPLIYLLLTLMGFPACRKEKAVGPGYSSGPAPDLSWPLYIPNEMKAYVEFKPGTYWVYKDSISGQLDSVYVTYHNTGFDTTTGHIFYDWGVFEWLITEYKSSRTGYFYYTYVHTVHSGWYPDQYPFRHELFVEKTKPGDYVGESKILEYPILVGNSMPAASNYPLPNDYLTTIQFYNAFYQDTSIFNAVVEVENNHYKPEGLSLTKHFHAKDIGVVRKEVIDSNLVWKLIRYSIVQ
jgi:hypothetical protein